jgi:hypothetical protein
VVNNLVKRDITINISIKNYLKEIIDVVVNEINNKKN